eukprot:15683-Heterococcus_DN1.PRE.2
MCISTAVQLASCERSCCVRCDKKPLCEINTRTAVAAATAICNCDCTDNEHCCCCSDCVQYYMCVAARAAVCCALAQSTLSQHCRWKLVE